MDGGSLLSTDTETEILFVFSLFLRLFFFEIRCEVVVTIEVVHVVFFVAVLSQLLRFVNFLVCIWIAINFDGNWLDALAYVDLHFICFLVISRLSLIATLACKLRNFVEIEV